MNTVNDDEENQSGGPSQAALGRALGLSRSAITKLKRQGMPIDTIEAAQAWREKRQSAAARKPLPTTFPPLNRPNTAAAYPDVGEDRDSARARREIAEADIAELTSAKMRRELISVTAVQAVLATEYATLRDALLQVGARLASVVAHESDPGVCANVIETEIRHCLTRLSGAADDVPNTPGGFD